MRYRNAVADDAAGLVKRLFSSLKTQCVAFEAFENPRN